MVVFTGGGNGPFYGIEKKATSQESIFYIQAILNHWLMELLVKSRASTFRGDYYSHGKQFIATLPIFKIDLYLWERTYSITAICYFGIISIPEEGKHRNGW